MKSEWLICYDEANLPRRISLCLAIRWGTARRSHLNLLTQAMRWASWSSIWNEVSKLDVVITRFMPNLPRLASSHLVAISANASNIYASQMFNQARWPIELGWWEQNPITWPVGHCIMQNPTSEWAYRLGYHQPVVMSAGRVGYGGSADITLSAKTQFRIDFVSSLGQWSWAFKFTGSYRDVHPPQHGVERLEQRSTGLDKYYRREAGGPNRTESTIKLTI